MSFFYKTAVKKTVVKKCSELNNLFQQQLRVIRVVLSGNLEVEYSTLRIGGDLEKCLAGQVVNYLLGIDIEFNASNSKDTIFKANYYKIRNKVKQYAENKMNSNLEVRKLIVYTLRMDSIIQTELYGYKYGSTYEYNRKYNLLSKYGYEFPDETNQDMYMELCKKFAQG